MSTSHPRLYINEIPQAFDIAMHVQYSASMSPSQQLTFRLDASFHDRLSDLRLYFDSTAPYRRMRGATKSDVARAALEIGLRYYEAMHALSEGGDVDHQAEALRVLTHIRNTSNTIIR